MREPEKHDDRPRDLDPRPASSDAVAAGRAQGSGIDGAGDRRPDDARRRAGGLAVRAVVHAGGAPRHPDDARVAPSARDRSAVDLTAPSAAARPDRAAASADRLARRLEARSDSLRSTARTERGLARDDDARAAALREDADTADRRADGIEARDAEDVAGVAPAAPERAVAAAAREDAHVAYDSGARRDAWAADLERRGVDRELAAARVRSDVSQARPAMHASGGPRRATSARGRGAALARTRAASRVARSR